MANGEREQMTEVDAEVEAVRVVAAALEPLDERQRRRVVEWARERYCNPMDKATDLILKMIQQLTPAVRAAIKNCPVCGGKGLMPPDEANFRSQCPYCTPLRNADDACMGAQ